jgi:predicted branched-subunit amino acid permease
MTAGFIGFGSLAAEAGVPFWISAMATALIWGLPGQIILVEMYASNAAAIAAVLAVMMSGARFLPMAMSLMPQLRGDREPGLWQYVTAQFVSMTSWAMATHRYRTLEVSQRASYLVGFGSVCILIGIVCCGVGYLLSSTLPHEVRMGLVYLTSAYFIVLLFGDIRTAKVAAALLCGAIAGPAIHLYAPQWSVLLGGLVGGTIAYVIQRQFRVRQR